jgi:rubrerythrin
MEEAEIDRYTTLLDHDPDEATRAMIEQFLAAERKHAEALGGKWMGAEPSW